MIHKHQLRNLYFGGGIFLVALATFIYTGSGFNYFIFLLWAAGLGLAGYGLRYKEERFWHQFHHVDAYVIYGLLLIFIPLLFAYIYSVPFQMNTDEATIMYYQKILSSSPDIFSTSSYFGFASFIFIFTGKLQNLLGGIDILNARIVHASMGLVLVIFAYIFFRQFWRPFPAFLATLVLGTNHALVAISRMAMRDNSVLLVTVVALPFLFYGLMKRSRYYLFVGGALTGLTFYAYQPGRILIFIWLGFLLALKLTMGKHYHWNFLFKAAVTTVVGFALVILPLFAYSSLHPDEGARKFSRERFLFYPEGQKLQQEWVVADSVGEGIAINIQNGLGTFNNRMHDLGYIYNNPGHGFTDPVSGILLWIGVASVLMKIALKKQSEADVLALFGFSTLWLLFAFVINKSPIYTRLFIILPFFAYLVVSGMMFLANTARHALRKIKFENYRIINWTSLIGLTLLVVGLNFWTFAVYAREGLRDGNTFGGTARYIEERKKLADYSYVVVADSTHPYFDWGEAWIWIDWVEVFSAPNQNAIVIPPDFAVGNHTQTTNFTMFMNSSVWAEKRDVLQAKYPNLRVHSITEHSKAIEIGSKRPGNTP